MKQLGGEASPSRRGVLGALANKRAADSRARALASIIHELRAAGIIFSRWGLADELNRRGIPTARGGRWHYTTVVRMLSRLDLLASFTDGRINNGQAGKQPADAKAMTPGKGPRYFRCHRARVERARDSDGTGEPMAPNQC
jgi:hypothetical protein